MEQEQPQDVTMNDAEVDRQQQHIEFPPTPSCCTMGDVDGATVVAENAGAVVANAAPMEEDVKDVLADPVTAART